MTIEEIIQVASTQPLDQGLVAQVRARQHLSPEEFYNAFARDVASKYLQGLYVWAYADMAMNHLLSYWTLHEARNFIFPDFAHQVFIAFDEGEYLHSEDSPNNGESRTKAFLVKIARKEHL